MLEQSQIYELMRELEEKKSNPDEAKSFLLQIIEENKGDRKSISAFLSAYKDSNPIFNGTLMENKTERDDFIKTLVCDNNIFDLPEGNKEFIEEVFDKLGYRGFENIEDEMFSKEAIETLGKETVYELIKYYKVPGRKVDLQHVVSNPELFNEYQEFVQTNEVFPKSQMEVMDKYKFIQNFNGRFEIINNCMNEDLSEEEKKLLIGYLREGLKIGENSKPNEYQEAISQMENKEAITYLEQEMYNRYFEQGQRINNMGWFTFKAYRENATQQMSDEEKVNYYISEFFTDKTVENSNILSSKEDLNKFPELRYEKYSKMIESGDKDVITELLAGMGYNEYEKKLNFLNDNQMENIITDFEEGNESFQKILAVNKVIQLILGLDKEQQKEVLQNINSELAKEFTQEGSEIADARAAFDGAVVEARKLYGKELSQSLKESRLPQTEKDEENGVEIVKLEGQDFKLIIHGIDVFGKGTGRFEPREIGTAYISCSLISDQSIKYIGQNAMVGAGGCFYGFSDVGENSLIFSSDGDVGTGANQGTNDLEFESTRKIEMTKTEKLLENTKNNKSAERFNESYLKDHNEVALLREYTDDNGQKHQIKPSYIVSFSSRRSDKLQKLEIEEAKRLGIPIVYIDEEKYKERRKQDEKDNNHIGQEDKGLDSVKAHEVTIDTLHKISEIVPSFKANEAFKTIVDEMSKTKEQQKEASTYER